MASLSTRLPRYTCRWAICPLWLLECTCKCRWYESILRICTFCLWVESLHRLPISRSGWSSDVRTYSCSGKAYHRHQELNLWTVENFPLIYLKLLGRFKVSSMQFLAHGLSLFSIVCAILGVIHSVSWWTLHALDLELVCSPHTRLCSLLVSWTFCETVWWLSRNHPIYRLWYWLYFLAPPIL